MVESRRVKRRLGAAVVVLALSSAAIFEAQATKSRDRGPIPGRGLVVLLADTPPRVVKQAAEGDQEDGAVYREPYSVVDANRSEFLTPLRLLLLRAQLVAGQEGAQSCTSEAFTFVGLLKLAEEALNGSREDDVEGYLERAWAAFPCESEVLGPETLSKVLVFAAVLQVQREQDGVATLAQALAIHPEMPVLAGHSRQVQQAYELARGTLGRTKRIEVLLRRPDLPGISLLIDGKPVEGDRLALVPGPHFLQLAYSSGGAAASTVATLLPSAPAGVLEWPPDALQPNDKEDVLFRLGRAVYRGGADPELGTALEQLRKDGPYPWLLLLSPAQTDRPPLALWVRPDQRYLKIELEASGEGLLAGPWSSGTVRTVSIGSASLLAAGVYGGLCAVYCGDGGRKVPDGTLEDRAVYFGSGLAAGVALLGVVGAVVSASLEWEIPRSPYGERKRPGPARRLFVLRLSSGQGGTQVGLNVSW